MQAACATSGRGRAAKLAVTARQAPRVQPVQVATSRCGNSVHARLTPTRPRGTVLRAVSTEAMAEDAMEALIEEFAEVEDEDEYMSFSEVGNHPSRRCPPPSSSPPSSPSPPPAHPPSTSLAAGSSSGPGRRIADWWSAQVVVQVVDEVVEAAEAAEEEAAEAGRKGRGKRGQAKKGRDAAGASSIASGVRVEGLAKSFKNVEVLRNINWECQKGERVGLVGNNGAGKTTQLRIITGEMEADSGTVLLAKRAQVAYLTQEFEVVETRTVREEFLTVFSEQVRASQRRTRLGLAAKSPL